MKKITCVTFPRSGHHLLIGMLASYYGKDLNFLQNQAPRIQNSQIYANELIYCEYYRHCKTIPCSNPDTTMQKNHDFGLSMKIKKNQHYIIQYRDPIPCLISFYEMTIRTHHIEDSNESFQRFFDKNILYYAAFVKKWVKRKKQKNIYVLKYENMVENPRDEIRKVIEYCSPKMKIDSDWLEKVIEAGQVQSHKNVEDFRYYNKKLLSKCKFPILKHRIKKITYWLCGKK